MTSTVIPKPAPPKRVRCPRPDKQAFPTFKLSEEKRVTELGKMINRGWTTHLPTYSYQCSCTFWHWTSQPPGKRSQLSELKATV